MAFLAATLEAFETPDSTFQLPDRRIDDVEGQLGQAATASAPDSLVRELSSSQGSGEKTTTSPEPSTRWVAANGEMPPA
jgi:hypothetical protein